MFSSSLANACVSALVVRSGGGGGGVSVGQRAGGEQHFTRAGRVHAGGHRRRRHVKQPVALALRQAARRAKGLGPLCNRGPRHGTPNANPETRVQERRPVYMPQLTTTPRKARDARRKARDARRKAQGARCKAQDASRRTHFRRAGGFVRAACPELDLVAKDELAGHGLLERKVRRRYGRRVVGHGQPRVRHDVCVCVPVGVVEARALGRLSWDVWGVLVGVFGVAWRPAVGGRGLGLVVGVTLVPRVRSLAVERVGNCFRFHACAS